MADADNSRRPRSRNLKRTFVFLRKDDELRVPGKQQLKNLQDSGREKEIEFSNNATTEHIAETLKNSFPAFLHNVDLARLYCYKSIGSTRVLSERGSCQDMCGDTLKLLFKYGGKIYLRLKQDNQGASAQGNSNRSVQRIPSDTDDSDDGDNGSDNESDNDDENSVEQESNSSDNNQEYSSEEDSNEGDEEKTDGSDIGNNEDSHHGLSENDSDSYLGQPVFQSTPSTSGLQRNSQLTRSSSGADSLVCKLYDTLVITGATMDKAASGRAREAGTITELEDHLTAAEANPMSGPSHDTQVFRLFLKEHDVPQQLALLCLDAKEMRLQSHLDCTPLVLIRYELSHQMAKIIRSIMQSESCLKKLANTYVHVTLMGSSFDTEVCCKLLRKAHRTADNVEVVIFQPTMSSQRMVVGNILTGNEMDFLRELQESVEEACQAGNALSTQRRLLEDTRQLKRRQEAEFRLSEETDKEKEKNAKQQDIMESEETEGGETDQEGENDLNSTERDTTEVMRKRRMETLANLERHSKRRNETGSDDENDEDNSGTVTFKPR